MKTNMFQVRVLVEGRSEAHERLQEFLTAHQYEFSSLPIQPKDYITSRYAPPFRIGKKQKRVVLDSKGLEVVLFPRGAERLAEVYCAALNREMQG